MTAGPPGSGDLIAPSRTPLYEAQHAPRYERQRLIREYEEANKCRLVVMIDQLFSDSITLFEETLYDADPQEDLHLMLGTPGGDGETALRLARQAQSRCKKLTVIVPEQAKSAGTLFVLGADCIYMGPTSDLGPVDPQLRLPDGSVAAARAIIAAVDEAEERVQKYAETYTVHVSLLSDITALMVQQARDAIARTGDLLKEVLACVSERRKQDVDDLFERLEEPLIKAPQSHGAVISTHDAIGFGLPVEEADPASSRWRQIWRMWAKYRMLNDLRIYEGRTASWVHTQVTS